MIGKSLLVASIAFLLAGCYSTTYVETSQPTVVYTEYSPPVVISSPVCYMRTVPQYGYRQVIHQPTGEAVIAGSAVGAAVGHELADNNRALGAVVGAIVGGSIVNTPRVTTERVVIGSTQERVCNVH